MQEAGRLNNGAVTDYALGLHVERRAGRLVVSHAGATAGYRAYVGWEPELGVALALLGNVGSMRSDILGPTLLELACGETPLADAAPELGPDVGDGARGRLAGLYRSGRTRQPVTVAAFRDGVRLNGRGGYRQSSSGLFVNGAGTRALKFAQSAAGPCRRFESMGPGGDTLFLVGRGVRDPLEPVHRDAFTGSESGWLLTFARGARGVISGFEVGMTRTRRVPFRRVAQ